MKDHRKKLSSALTAFNKFIFPTVWVGGFAESTINLIIRGDSEWTSSLLATIAGLIFFWLLSMPLKKVFIEKDELVISNYFKTIRLPLREIQDVKENRFINFNPVWLILKTECSFGKKIMFMPPIRFTFFFAHPVVEYLRKIIMYRIDEI